MVPGDDVCGGLERKRTKGVQNFTLGFLARRGVQAELGGTTRGSSLYVIMFRHFSAG